MRFWMMISVLLLTGCGFHLRETLNIAEQYQPLCIEPLNVSDPFQRILRQQLKAHHVRLATSENTQAVRLHIQQASTERALAYSTTGQTNRIILQFTLTYHITDPQGNILFPETLLQAERELTFNPNMTLSTDQERQQLLTDLWRDTATQLIQQLAHDGR
jgi:LPS-assembly lipoprotein